jgi:membrane associated rhomboid family serine protease
VWLAVLESMFFHASILHLAGNMLFLWVFGNNVEDYLGRIAFILFYLVAGAVAMGAHVLYDPGSTTPVVGASGAIAGVMGMYFVLWPRARVLALVPFLLFLPLPLPAGLILLMWLVLQFFTPNTGVAWVAHVGGFVFGALVAFLLRKVKPPRRAGYLQRSPG